MKKLIEKFKRSQNDNIILFLHNVITKSSNRTMIYKGNLLYIPKVDYNGNDPIFIKEINNLVVKGDFIIACNSLSCITFNNLVVEGSLRLINNNNIRIYGDNNYIKGDLHLDSKDVYENNDKFIVIGNKYITDKTSNFTNYYDYNL